MDRPYLLRQGSNFDDLLRGLLYTEGRLSQPSYNPLVIIRTLYAINIMLNNNNNIYFVTCIVDQGKLSFMYTDFKPHVSSRQLDW